MVKHKSKNYRRNQRKRYIEKRKNIIRNSWYGDFDTFEGQEENTMPVTGKLVKGNVRDCMGDCSSFNEYTIKEQKRAASMLDELREEEELSGISGPLKSRLIRIVNNNCRHKIKRQSYCHKGTFSYREFQVFLSKSENFRFHIIKPGQSAWFMHHRYNRYLNWTA